MLRKVPLSRRVLEQRMQQVLGRSPAAEIRSARLRIARKLLVETSYSMPQVAVRSGFEHAEVLTRVFSREIGLTPTAYRRQFQYKFR